MLRLPKTGLIGLLLIGAAGTASAAPITYDVTVNTASLSGTTGSLDFNFNPGPLTTQAATVQIDSFSGAATSGSAFLTGAASGALPGVVTLTNGTAFNDYFQDVVYGTTLTFDLSLSGPALSSPDGTSLSGSGLAFSLFSDAAGTQPALTSDAIDGFAATVGVNLDGTTTVSNFSSDTSITAAGGSTSVPEPDSIALAAVGFVLALLGVYRRRRPTTGRARTNFQLNTVG